MFIIQYFRARPLFSLSVLYAVGLLGVLLPLHQEFMRLTPFNLLVSLGFVLDNHPGQPQGKGGLWTALALSYVAGWLLELAGVQTGWIFGIYEYGAALGPKLWGTPLMIGLNWAMLLYLVTAIGYAYLPQSSGWQRAALGATLMVFLDIWIEPVAVRYDFWAWQAPPWNALVVAPLQNYTSWWLAAFVLLLVFQRLVPSFVNKTAEGLYGLQLLFFFILFWF